MPTATESTRSDISDAVERVTTFTRSDVGDAVDQVTKLNERVVEAGKRVGIVYLDGYKKSVAAASSAGRKTSGQSLGVARTLVGAQTKVAGELTKACSAVPRKVLAAA
jgi:hypothetical protein